MPRGGRKWVWETGRLGGGFENHTKGTPVVEIRTGGSGTYKRCDQAKISRTVIGTHRCTFVATMAFGYPDETLIIMAIPAIPRPASLAIPDGDGDCADVPGTVTTSRTTCKT